MPVNTLTDMQKAFCDAIEQGKRRTEAYEIAGYAYKDKADRSNRASMLFNKKTIQAELVRRGIIEDKRRKAEQASLSAIATPNEIMQQYTAIIRDPATSTSDRMRAMDQLTKLQGIHGKATVKTDADDGRMMPGDETWSRLLNAAVQAKEGATVD